jgi:hypothetical protein
LRVDEDALRISALEIWLLLATFGCRAAPQKEPPPLPLLSPPRAGKFACAGDVCRQTQPRLPDTGEWSCAERDGVVWCTGGEPAAGVVPGLPDPSYDCGKRGGERAIAGERLCIDRKPDYPDASATYACRYEQERGTTRVCVPSSSRHRESLAIEAVPACWLDTDCRSRGCDRGACRCATDNDCEQGRCQAGLCTRSGP